LVRHFHSRSGWTDGRIAGPDGRPVQLDEWVHERLPGALKSGRVEALGMAIAQGMSQSGNRVPL